jgi:RNA polymerase sigma-70 factor, ECF subfamily
MHEGESDETLMAKTASGDHRAFRLLVARHMGRAIRLAEAATGNTSDADDIAQEAFVRVWNRASSFDPGIARFTTWLYRIVVNLAIDRARRPRAEPIECVESVATDQPDALAEIIHSEEQNALDGSMSELPERQRAAIALFHFEGLSGREAAEAMDMTEKAFESLLIRARATLKQRVLGRAAGRGGNNDTR